MALALIQLIILNRSPTSIGTKTRTVYLRDEGILLMTLKLKGVVTVHFILFLSELSSRIQSIIFGYRSFSAF